MRQFETARLLLQHDRLMAKFGGSAPLLAHSAGLFLVSWEGELENLKRCIQADDSHGCAKAIHSLKGSIGFFAEDNFFQEAADMEGMARRGQLHEVIHQLPGFEKRLNRFAAELEEMRESLC